MFFKKKILQMQDCHPHVLKHKITGKIVLVELQLQIMGKKKELAFGRKEV